MKKKGAAAPANPFIMRFPYPREHITVLHTLAVLAALFIGKRNKKRHMVLHNANYKTLKPYKSKKESFLLSFFLSNRHSDYQHLVLWNDDAGRPAPL